MQRAENEWQDVAKEESGRFRRKLFGGFHRKDVIDHMQTMYGELEFLREENNALAQQVYELGNLLQAIEASNAAEQAAGANAYYEPEPYLDYPEYQAEVVDELQNEVEHTLTEPLLPNHATESAFGAPPTWGEVEYDNQAEQAETIVRAQANLSNPYPGQGVQKVKVRKAQKS